MTVYRNAGANSTHTVKQECPTQSGNQIAINDRNVTVVECAGQRVITFKMVDELHQRPEGTARRNFNTNKGHLSEGEDYFVRNSSEAKAMGFTAPNGLILLTESGYLMMVKSFTDDLAWKVQKELVRSYFLRQQPKHEIPRTLHEALRLAADTEEKRIAAEAQVVALTPKAEALDRISTADGSYGLYEAAKILQVGPQKFVQWLASNGWVYKRTGSKTWLARQEKINAGYLWHKVRTYTDSNGEEKTRDDVRVLPKGLTKLAQVIPGAAIDPYLTPESVPPFAPTPARTA